MIGLSDRACVSPVRKNGYVYFTVHVPRCDKLTKLTATVHLDMIY